MSELGMRKVQILSWLLQNVTLRRQVQRDQQCIDRRQELHLPIFIAIKGIGRHSLLLPHAKMLLVPISFFLCWVDYALEGSTFSLSKCDFSLLLHTERSWHTYPFTVVFLSGRQDFPPDEKAFLWPLLKRKAFYRGWIRVLLFSNVPSVSEYLSNFLYSVNAMFFCNVVSRWVQLVSFLCRMLKNYRG